MRVDIPLALIHPPLSKHTRTLTLVVKLLFMVKLCTVTTDLPILVISPSCIRSSHSDPLYRMDRQNTWEIQGTLTFVRVI
jgi:hypothetical protein